MGRENPSRRRLLQVGGAGLLAGVGVPGIASAAADELIVSNVGFDSPANYEFTVSGSVDPRSGGLAGDSVDGTRAWGRVDTWKDGYEFTGEVTSFSHDGPVRVLVNGSEVDPASLGSGGASDRHRVVVSNVGFDSPATYEFATSGSVSALSGGLAGDSVDGNTARGRVDTWKDGYEFAGEITSFSHDGPVRVLVDGTEVDPAAFGDGGGDSSTWRGIVVSNVGFDEPATYEFTADDAVASAAEAPAGDNVDGTRAWGRVDTWKDGYRFRDEITSFTHDGPVRVLVDGEEVDPETLGAGGDPDSGGADPSAEGESFDDFETLGDWTGGAGSPAGTGQTTDAAYRGERCGVTVHDGSDDRIWTSISKEFPEPVDVAGKQFSIAVKSALPHDSVLRVHFVDADGREITHTGKYLGRFTDEWVSIPLGVDEVSEADPGNVTRAVVSTRAAGGSDGPVYVDDLRWDDAPERGRVVFTFDDMPDGVYDHAFPAMEKHGLCGTMGYWPRPIGWDGYMTDAQTAEMVDAGWDCSAHPQSVDGGLPDFSAAEQERMMRDVKEMLVDKGFTGAEDSIIWPYGEVGTRTREVASELFSLGLLAMGGNTAFSLGSRFDAARENGEDTAAAKARIDAAERFGSTCVLMYHDIGDEDISAAEFEGVVEHAAAADVDVVTVGEWLDERRAARSD